ncbi:MAG TPA: hypothetical protein VE465_12855 [Streptosporangiaceae bacterium]|nr:hypothetical protein [Streptosporangiaceae bacterium]
MRHWVHIPRDARQVRIEGTIDNDARVYFNGHLVQTALSGNCATGAIDAVVPDRHLDCCNPSGHSWPRLRRLDLSERPGDLRQAGRPSRRQWVDRAPS